MATPGALDVLQEAVDWVLPLLPRRYAAAAHTLADDYRALAHEILERITHRATAPSPTG